MLHIANLLYFISYFILLVVAKNETSTHFTNISIIDSFTNGFNCTDANHQFLVSAEIYLTDGENGDIYFTIPDSFTNFSSIPSIIYDSSNNKLANVFQVGTSNTFGLEFASKIYSDAVVSFNFLTKLSNAAQELITSPQSITYNFNTTTGDNFDTTINFTEINSIGITTNGAVFSENGTAWFTTDIPVKLLNSAVTFQASAVDFKFDLKKTKVQVIGSVDALGNPLKLVPFTAYTDNSVVNEIKISIDTNISGGKFVRISYFSEKIDSVSINSKVSLLRDDGLAKRDSSNSAVISTSSVTLYNNNEEHSIADTSSISGSSSVSSIRLLYANSTYVKPTSTTTKEQLITAKYVTNGLTTYDVVTITQDPILTQMVSYVAISTLPTSVANSTIVAATSTISTEAASQTEKKSKSTLKFETSNAVLDTFAANVTSTNVYGNIILYKNYKPSTTKILSTKVNGEIFTLTLSAQLSAETNLIAIGTIKNQTESTSTITTTKATVTISTSISSKNRVNSYIAKSSTTVIQSSNNQLKTYSKLSNATNTYGNNIIYKDYKPSTTKVLSTKVNGEIVTLTLSAQFSTETSLLAIGTVKNQTGSIVTTSTTKSKITTSTHKADTKSVIISKSKIINSYSTAVLTSIFAKTQNAIKATHTSLVPLATLKNVTSTQISCDELTKTLSALEIVETSLNAIGKLQNTTIGNTRTSVLAKTQSAIKTTKFSLVPLSTIKSNTTTVSPSTIKSIQTSILAKTQSAIKSAESSLILLSTIKDKTAIVSPCTSVLTSVSSETKAAVRQTESKAVPISTLSTVTSTKKSIVSSTKKVKTVTTRMTSSLAAHVITTADIVAISSIQSFSSSISIEAYEAGAYKINWSYTNYVFFAIAFFL